MTDERKAPPHAWRPGQSGNPAGKPPGTRNRATMMVLALMEEGAEEVAGAIVNAAKAGDLGAAKLVLERLAPPVRERAIAVDLPDTATLAGVSEAQRAVVRAVGEGELLPTEGNALASILEARRRAIETEELEQRIRALEARHDKR